MIKLFRGRKAQIDLSSETVRFIGMLMVWIGSGISFVKPEMFIVGSALVFVGGTIMAQVK